MTSHKPVVNHYRRKILMGISMLMVLAGCSGPDELIEQSSPAIFEQYRSNAEIGFRNALTDAQSLNQISQTFINKASPENHQKLKDAYRRARRSYSVTEALRFGNWFVDEWEHEVNAWPIDEGLIDYVVDPYHASSNNPLAQHNLVSNPLITIGNRSLDSSIINRQLLENIQSIGDFESNVTTGYHAIEFLIWGQDTSVTGAGQRPASDFDTQRCTNGHQIPAMPVHCQRRGDLLITLTDKLVFDLIQMVRKWPNSPGYYGHRLVNGDRKQGLRRILFGIERLLAEELSGERIQVALFSIDQEDELDCFSDLTHVSLTHNFIGAMAFYFGLPFDQITDFVFAKTQQTSVQVTAHKDSVATLIEQLDSTAAQTIRQRWLIAALGFHQLYRFGEQGQPFDQQIKYRAKELQQLVNHLHALADAMQVTIQLLELDYLNPLTPRMANN